MRAPARATVEVDATTRIYARTKSIALHTTAPYTALRLQRTTPVAGSGDAKAHGRPVSIAHRDALANGEPDADRNATAAAPPKPSPSPAPPGADKGHPNAGKDILSDGHTTAHADANSHTPPRPTP